MKVTTKEAEEMKKFKPFTLNITFESEDEVKTIYALFNHSTLTDFMQRHASIDDSAIRELLRDTSPETTDYHTFFNDLNRVIRG